jgi:ribosomal protein L40E
MAEQCSRCGSSRLIPNIPLPDRTHRSSETTATVRVHANPQAWVRKDTALGDLLLTICGDCGHADLKANNHRELYTKYLQSIGRVAESEDLASEFDCLACGAPIAGAGSSCPKCGWSWQATETDA